MVLNMIHPFHLLYKNNIIKFHFSCTRTSQRNNESSHMLQTINNIIYTHVFHAHFYPYFGSRLFLWPHISLISYSPPPSIITPYFLIHFTTHIFTFACFRMCTPHTSPLPINSHHVPPFEFSPGIHFNNVASNAFTLHFSKSITLRCIFVGYELF